MAPIMLTFNVLYWAHAFHRQTREEIEINRVATIVVDGFFLALIAFGIFAAFRSMSLAGATSQPKALGIGGLLICGLNMILWIALGLHLLAVMNTFV
jgi:hypothetical protein